ncbi:hypothetical protein EDD65_1086 [Keratinibaculum paraultunense]|uniref:Glutamate decarboxylase n=1 Tax=Keratinibaculum paraultunense TaxID=1278232 RepID=A0A4R3KTI4_9FIRM|nr:hypothetical protein [Keratinibaculum paraultunense]QQY79093.1 hypothetical protein JL105_07825 [Keratinibaculum paraultunense]TCS88474.1 hypothetical protein EDD65_1086 [Keratinibaculum paraultunense]
MWTTVYVTTSLEQATEIEKKLKEEGFLIKKQLFSIEGDEELYEILAPEVEAKDVQMVLYNLGIL